MSQYSKRRWWLALILAFSTSALLFSNSAVMGEENAEVQQSEDTSGTPEELLDEKGFLNLKDLGIELPSERGRGVIDEGILDGSQTAGPVVVFKKIISGGRAVIHGTTMPKWLVGDIQMTFSRPTALAVKGNSLYVVDAARSAVFRYNLERDTLEIVIDTSEHFKGEPSALFVGKDGAVYVVDPAGSQVVSFNANGKKTFVYKDDMNLARPVDVHVNDDADQVYIADAGFGRITVFKKNGGPIYTIGVKGSGLGQFTNPVAFAVFDGNLYVVDNGGVPLQVLPASGDPYAIGEEELNRPNTIAVDNYGRIYVADNQNYYIYVFNDGSLIEKFGGASRDPNSFRDVADLYIDGDSLYIADIVNQRIQVYAITPP